MEFKVGQEVLYCRGGMYPIYCLCKVDKITPEGFIRVESVLYEDRGDGTAYARGRWDWGTPSITNNHLKISNYKKQRFIAKAKEKISKSKLTFEMEYANMINTKKENKENNESNN